MELRWGIIGFGEVGSAFAKHLLQQGATRLLATDSRFSADECSSLNRDNPGLPSIQFVPDIRTVVQDSDLCLSLVTPRAASEVGEAAASCWAQGLFIDFNSISPMQKRQIASLFPPRVFVGGAILGSVAGEGASSQLALDGPSAEHARALLDSAGFNSTAVGEIIGAAAALKMCRSIFMKGIECLSVETLLAASHFQITDAVLESLDATIRKYGFRPMIEMLVTTHALHCGRRSDEMQQVTEMLADIPLPNTMSEAARKCLSSSSSSGITQHFDRKLPRSAEIVIEFLDHHYEEND